LCHFEQRAADSVTISYAHLPIRQALDREILPELSIGKIVSTELVLPISIGIHLINENRPVFATMACEVPLPIAIDVEPTHQARASDRLLPHACMNGLPPPRDIPGKADVDRKQPSRHSRLLLLRGDCRSAVCPRETGTTIQSLAFIYLWE
jgi:hypothetical protein